jgi:flagellar biogenesis protein FliO
VALAVSEGSFEETLRGSMQDWARRRAAIQAQLRFVTELLSRVRGWLQSRCVRTTERRLRVAETVSLGEKRFVALVSVEGKEFLIGGGASGVSLLARLGSTELQEGSCE